MHRKARAWLTVMALSIASGALPALEPPFEDELFLRFNSADTDIAIESETDAVAWPADFTLEAWVYVLEARPNGSLVAGRVAANRGVDPHFNVALGFDAGVGLRPSINQSTGSPGTWRLAQSPTAIPARQWVHLAGQREGAVLRLFVDGVLVATGTSAGPPATLPGVPFAIGAGSWPDGSGAQCCGSEMAIRNVKLWRRALTASEVLASSSANEYALPPVDLVRFWRLDEGRGTRLSSALPGGSPLQAGLVNGRSRPYWVETAFLEPIFRKSVSNISLRSLPHTLWPVRIGAETHFLVTGIHFPPTFPETTTPVSTLSPGASSLVGSSDQRLVGTPLSVHANDGVAIDANSDGRQDFVIADHGTDTHPFPGSLARLYIQQADGRLADETQARLPHVPRFHHNIAAGDFDGDGHHDIFFCSFTPDDPAKAVAIMRNNGSGIFAQANAGTLPALLESGSRICLASRTIDVDRDGDLDLVASLYEGGRPDTELHDRILLNDGSGRFTLAPANTLPQRRPLPHSSTVKIEVDDVDGDGIDDLLMGTTHQYLSQPVLRYLRGRGDGSFEDRTLDIPNDWPLETWIDGIHAQDFDGDGRKDLLLRLNRLVYAFDPDRSQLELLLNRGRDWIAVSRRVGMKDLVPSAPIVSPVDADGDGDLDLAVVDGQSSAGYLLRVRPFPLNIRRPAHALGDGAARSVRLNPGESHERLYFDVPPTASEVRFELTSTQNVDLYLSRRPFSTGEGIRSAPGRANAVASATSSSGNEVLTLTAPQLSAGRWYVTPVNADTLPADLVVKATIIDAAPAPDLAAGHFYNPSRSGHGVSYEYVAGQRVLIWYTYLEDGTPIWYYAQGIAPSPNRGTWSADLLQFRWDGDSNHSQPVGSVRVTELGKQGGSDRIVFSWNLNGDSGSESMERLGGGGCPSGFDGNNGMWFAPSLPGYGYTVTYFQDYEFMPVYLYDERGEPRWMSGEKAGFSAADTAIPLFQLTGFCPSCARPPSLAYQPAGTMTRRFSGNRISGLALNAVFASPVRGNWIQDRPIQLLTNPSPCVVP